MEYTMGERMQAEEQLRARGITPPTGVITSTTIGALDEVARHGGSTSTRTLLLALEIVTVQRDAARKEVEELRRGRVGA